uniref:Uncharacterized protein n=1 Tax=Rhizophagus irregularis (strain DAOM 181602 / DAOM 197198 / MUCL 43194) TaxID=747089 RepID=U9TXL4_RHIID
MTDLEIRVIIFDGIIAGNDTVSIFLVLLRILFHSLSIILQIIQMLKRKC